MIAAGGTLDRIVEAKARSIGRSKRQKPLSILIHRAEAARGSRKASIFVECLNNPDRINVIAEAKHRSPSKGLIREEFDPVAIASSYAHAGAVAASVLTEEDFFGGSLDHLRAIRHAQPDLPLLRKDFVFDDYQLWESAEAGADAILLIVAILSDGLLRRLIALSAELGLDALVEVHTEEEMKRALGAGARLIGINNRDLTTFAVDIDTSIKLAPLAPRDAILVAESGITTAADIKRLKAAGCNAYLIGEHLMRAEDPGIALRQLLESADRARPTV